MKLSGIYKIQSIKKPNKIYIGSAKNIHKRWYYHLYFLRNGNHVNKKLQLHYDKYGEFDLQFSILLGCEIDDLLKTEQYFIDSYKPFFNICPFAKSQLGVKRTNEQKKRMSDAQKGKKLTEDHKMKLSISGRGKKKHFSDETKRRMSESAKKRKSNVLGKHWELTEKQKENASRARRLTWVKRKLA